jgi:hypothetical protein
MAMENLRVAKNSILYKEVGEIRNRYLIKQENEAKCEEKKDDACVWEA